ncbi:MAG: hypothetical protein JWR03_2419 [Cohnella sp.]|nr:hypothetical protein [Cohnella sp.]
MAWDVAAYAIAVAALTAAGIFAAGIIRLCRSLTRWDRMAEGFARKADSALDEYVRFAAEGRETAELCRSTFSGFKRLADGARAVGDAAESAAEAAAHVASFWRDMATFGSGQGEDDVTGATTYWSGIVRTLAKNVRRSFFSSESDLFVNPHPGASADPQTGE